MQPESRLDNIKDVPIFFILGSARSGTTLLRFILDSHENIYIPLETPYITFFYKKYNNIKKWDETSFEKLYKDLSYFGKFKQWKVDKNKLKDEILYYGENASFQTICKIIHTNYFSLNPKKEIKIIGDKNVPYLTQNKLIHELFPEAKYIHIVRDYRGQVFSMFKTDIFSRIVSSLATRWKYQNKKIEKLKALVPANFITICYEDMVDDVETTIKKICAFLNVEFNSHMILDSQRNKLNNVFNENDIEKYHHSLTEPINQGKKEEWRKGLSENQIKICDYIAGKFASKYNYFPVFNQFSFAFKIKCLPGIVYGYLLYPCRKILRLFPFHSRHFFLILARKYIFLKK